MKQAGIGIVIPVYNRERELRRTFDSVVAQTYRPIHVVLVDNGSTDGSLALCRAARNRGLTCVTEEFVAFLDSDDEYIPEAVSLYMQAFESNSSADIAGCTIRLIPEQGKPYSAKAVFSNRVEPHLFHSTLGTVRYAVRTAVVRAVGGWPEDYMRWEDWGLGIKLLLFTDRIVWVQTPPLVNVYLHADSITGYRYVPNVPDILRAIVQAHEDVERSDSAQKARLHKLLLYKQMVVAGLCRKEKSPLGTEIYRSTMETAGKDRTMRWFLPIVYRYVSWGGRGSAILANRLLR